MKILNEYETIPYIRSLELDLPYVIVYNLNDKSMTILYLDETNYKTIKEYRENNNHFYYVCLFLRRYNAQYSLGIELSGYIEIEPQRIKMNRNFFYEWDKKTLTIRKFLGTKNIEKIKEFTLELMNEFKKFYFIYSKNLEV